MSDTFNPLVNMTEVLGHNTGKEIRPDETFIETALPGFKLALNARRSNRIYDDEKIPEEIMRDCLKDALLAPSSSNLQTYELYWVRDEDKKQEVQHACFNQPAAKTAAEIIVVVARGDLWDVNLKKLVHIMSRGGIKELPKVVDDYYHKITPMIMKTDAFGIYNLIRRVRFWYKGLTKPFVRTPINKADHRIYAHIQSSLAAQTLMLSLAAHGYDSCPMGGMDGLRIKKTLGLPRQAEVSMVISTGRGKTEGLYGARVRLGFDDLIKEV